jgi:hypothetical protein
MGRWQEKEEGMIHRPMLSLMAFLFIAVIVGGRASAQQSGDVPVEDADTIDVTPADGAGSPTGSEVQETATNAASPAS